MKQEQPQFFSDINLSDAANTEEGKAFQEAIAKTLTGQKPIAILMCEEFAESLQDGEQPEVANQNKPDS